MRKITFNDILEAKKRVDGIIRKTPFEYSQDLSEMFDAEIYLKMEFQQRSGSFKLRGATNKISLLSETELEKGIIAASSGNHSQAVGYVAREMGIDALIVLPENAPVTKIERTKRYGAAVKVAGRDFDACEAVAHEIERETGRTFVHAFADPDTMAGQGTLGFDMMEEHPDLDMVLVPVGGGGLMTGVGTAVKAMNPNTRVIGIQTETSKPWVEAFRHKKYVKVSIEDSLADGLPGDIIEPEMIEGFNAVVDHMIAVDEEPIAEAIFFMLDKHHQVVEGSGVVGIAALLSGKLDVKGKKVGIALTGCSCDMKTLKEIINKYV
ncbi:threonine ammonia-lyase [Bacilliculturomica massiliensis]|uniref:threonine ammonia-lyase n=1 Tax=Bacilliculturomica massiliensis TaxID=1917867 RepID=UPI00102F96B5|nr:threonine/serine dehydratase [Bacilliculturomica massiliensis]